MRVFNLLALIALVATAGRAQSPALELRFERLNGLYENLAADVAPIESGAVTIHLSSPEHRLQLISNQLDLSPLGDGRHAFRGLVRFAGSGSLNAELDFGGIPASLHDEVVFPEQERVVEGQLRIEIVDEGYLVTVEELPRFIDIEMRSRLGSELVTWCSRLALFLAGDAGCDELDQQLSRPRLPLPAPGTSELVRADELTAEERAQIDFYLTSF